MYTFLSVFVMSLVTYIPRVLPIACFKRKIKSRFIRSFLYYMPYAVLASLAFPAVFYSTGNLYAAIIATSLAVVLSIFKVKLIFTVIVMVIVALLGGYYLK